MARKRKRRAINWGPVLALLLALNVLFGLFLSPLTSVRRLRVVGAPAHERRRLEGLSRSMEGVPFVLVPAKEIESRALAASEVRSARLRHNLFGGGLLEMEYRRPVAAIAGMPGAMLDDQGALYRSPHRPAGLPELRLDEKFTQPGLTLAGNWPMAGVASLCERLKTFKEMSGYAVRLDATGRLWLNREGSGLVALGGAEALDQKLRVMRDLLAERPDLLSTVERINLSVPDRPALKSSSQQASR